ncbi:hypothetical protein DFH06DRAFT_459138 [Mycena polygramma]|nr:hypothetical protein DFH06DRAFT_459138 [Mycena polygramma]
MPLLDGIAVLLLTPTMNDLEKGTIPVAETQDQSTPDSAAETESVKAAKKAKDNPEHEAAAAKLWAVYVSEAEKYDRGLVESWKSDMEGMLIFAGLFSASLTAFLIESYKTLNPDPENTTALLLAQISQQLAASANGTPFHIPPTTPFTPPTSSVICNVLWFISLGLSLTSACALIATLLEQWARDFLHRADMRSAPVVRARVFSFLYYGFKRFKMHTVVEIIPLLLHSSLFLFFIGLVAFLLPVNVALTAVAGIILTTVTVVYALLTLLPLVHSDCPYRTPLSGGLWRLRRGAHALLNRLRPSVVISPQRDDTMVEAIFREAIEPSTQRSSRDAQALIWTVKSLAHDDELDPFIAAIPDVLWSTSRSGGGYKRRYVYEAPMRRLMDDPDAQFLKRLAAFEGSCSSTLLSPEVRIGRQIRVCEALWALSSLAAACRLPFPQVFRGRLWGHLESQPKQVRPYIVSAAAMGAWAATRAAQPLLDETLQHLTACKLELSTHASKIPDLTQLSACMSKLAEHHIYPSKGRLHERYNTMSPEAVRSDIDNCIERINAWPFFGIVEYLCHAAIIDEMPYRFEATRSLIRPTTQIPSSAELRESVVTALERVMDKQNLFRTHENLHWLDGVFKMVLSYWEPRETESLPSVVLDCMDRCDTVNLLGATERGFDCGVAIMLRGPMEYKCSDAHALRDCDGERLLLLRISMGNFGYGPTGHDLKIKPSSLTSGNIHNTFYSGRQ